MFKYSFDALVWFGEEFSKSANRLARFGYDAIEMVGEPESYNFNEVRKIVADNGLEVSSICSIFSDDRDLAHPDASIRKNANDYVKSVVNMAAEVGASVMTITPTPCMKTQPLTNREDELKWAVEGIQAAAELAEVHNVKLVLEGWNRYEHYWLNRLDQCLDLMKSVNRKNVGVMGDTFHMNIEESSLSDAIKKCGESLFHFHLADSNRAAPGTGHLDFVPVIQALKDINYQGYLAYEILPAVADPFGVIRRGVGEEFLDQYAEQCITYIKSIEASLK